MNYKFSIEQKHPESLQDIMDLPRSWYPLCLSKEIKKGQVKAIHAFNVKWAVFRGDDGRVAVMHHQCAHVGADLCQGFVSDNHLVCPLHHWHYDRNGIHRTSENNILCQKKRLLALPVEERWGMVMVFLGRHADYPLPHVQEGVKLLSAPVFIKDYPAPYQMVGLNGFDEHHLGPVHGRQLLAPAEIDVISDREIKISYKARVAGDNFRDRLLRKIGAGSVHIGTHCIGGSLLFFRHHKYDASVVFGLLPLSENRTRLFIALQRPDNGALRILRKLAMRIQRIFVINFIRDDFSALMHSRFAPEGLTPEKDRTMYAWCEHYRKLPLFDLEDEE